MVFGDIYHGNKLYIWWYLVIYIMEISSAIFCYFGGTVFLRRKTTKAFSKWPIASFINPQRLKRPSHDKQLANMLANCWRQIELVSILAYFFTDFIVLVNSYLTCEPLANMSCQLSTCLPTVVVSFTHANLSLPTREFANFNWFA